MSKAQKKYRFLIKFSIFKSYNYTRRKEMVGSIKNFTGQRVDMSKGMSESKVQSEKLDDSNAATISGSKVDAVLTSKSREALKVMAENPAINMEAVERIKEKIKNGEYPIDFDKLADKLLESYWNSESQ